MIVAYQGVRGAFSESALRKHFGARAQARGLALSEEVFEAVKRGEADFGILPVENTIAGPVSVNTDLFLKEDVFVVGETYLRIEHCLLGIGSLKDVRTVYSHPVALAQCQTFLKRHRLRGVPEYDTAGAAELVAHRGLRDEAAIASQECARAYGLRVLAKNIQSYRQNITRFLAFTRHDRIPKRLKMQKTSLAFSTRHKPGALLSCLQRFAEHRINLTRLESRPIPENPFEYVFFVDLIGGREEPAVKAALSQIKKDAHRLKIIGSYPMGAKPT